MLGKVVLVAGAGAAYVLRTPEVRARLARLVQGVGAASPGTPPAALPAGATDGGTGSAVGPTRSRARLRPALRRSVSTGDLAGPRLVDRRPQVASGDGGAEAGTQTHLLPDARAAEIARSVSEEQRPR